MIGSIDVSGLLTAYALAEDEFPRSSRVEFIRAIGAKARHRRNIIFSATGAPISLSMGQWHHWTQSRLVARLQMPVALAIYGPRHLSGWDARLSDEKRIASLLARTVLEQQGFTRQEVSGYINSAWARSFTLVWQVQPGTHETASELIIKAACQAETLFASKSLPGTDITDYSFVNSAGECRLALTTKSGNGIALRLRSQKLAEPSSKVVQVVEVEITIGGKLIFELGIENPGSWLKFNLELCADRVLLQTGFRRDYLRDFATANVSRCSRAAQDIFAMYLARKRLPNVSSSVRHEILRCGVDILVAHARHLYLDGATGRQIHFSNRWGGPSHSLDEGYASAATETLSGILAPLRTTRMRESISEFLKQQRANWLDGNSPKPRPPPKRQQFDLSLLEDKGERQSVDRYRLRELERGDEGQQSPLRGRR